MELQNISSTPITSTTRSISTGLYEQAMEKMRFKSIDPFFDSSDYEPVSKILNQLERIQGMLMQAIELDPKHPGIRILMGEVEFLLGNTDAALASLSEAIRLNPGFSDAYYQAADVYKLRIAIRLYGKIIDDEMVKDFEAIRERGNTTDREMPDLIQFRLLIDQMICNHGKLSTDFSDWSASSSYSFVSEDARAREQIVALGGN